MSEPKSIVSQVQDLQRERNAIERDSMEWTAMPAKARRLLVSAAMDMTRMDRKMRKACELVLLEGLTYGEAGERVKRPRQNVYRAVAKLRPKLKEVTEYARQL